MGEKVGGVLSDLNKDGPTSSGNLRQTSRVGDENDEALVFCLVTLLTGAESRGKEREKRLCVQVSPIQCYKWAATVYH